MYTRTGICAHQYQWRIRVMIFGSGSDARKNRIRFRPEKKLWHIFSLILNDILKVRTFEISSIITAIDIEKMFIIKRFCILIRAFRLNLDPDLTLPENRIQIFDLRKLNRCRNCSYSGKDDVFHFINSLSIAPRFIRKTHCVALPPPFDN